MSAMAFSQAGLILSESEIEHPVTAIFDLPVRANGLEQLFGLTWQGRDKITVHNAAFFILDALRAYPDKRLQGWPVQGAAQMGEKGSGRQSSSTGGSRSGHALCQPLELNQR